VFFFFFFVEIFIVNTKSDIKNLVGSSIAVLGIPKSAIHNKQHYVDIANDGT